MNSGNGWQKSMEQPEIHQFFMELTNGVMPFSARSVGAFELDPYNRTVKNAEDLTLTSNGSGVVTHLCLYNHNGDVVESIPFDREIHVARGDAINIPQGAINMNFAFCIFCDVREITPRIDHTIKSLQVLAAELREELTHE